MTTRIHTKIATSIAGAALIAAIVVPGAVAGPSKITRIQIPPALTHFQEPGSTGYVPKTTLVKIPANLAHFQEPGSVGYVPAATASTNSGLDWASALIGAGAALGVALASAGALMVLRRRRTLAHT